MYFAYEVHFATNFFELGWNKNSKSIEVLNSRVEFQIHSHHFGTINMDCALIFLGLQKSQNEIKKKHILLS